MFECWDSCVSGRQKMSIAKVANHHFFFYGFREDFLGIDQSEKQKLRIAAMFVNGSIRN
jgi:hypothetical protein